MSPLILIKLKAGWSFDPDHGGLRRQHLRVVPRLPAGARLSPALRPTAAGKTAWPAERELARYVHLRLPAELPLIETLLQVRSWEFVERAELPPLQAV